jgi:hypothetical protein
MSPWIFLLFIAIFDFGFYAYGAISTANAARVAAMYTAAYPAAAGDVVSAFSRAADELRAMPNVGASLPAATCSGDTCTSGPIQVRARSLSGASCADYDSTPGVPAVQCSEVAVRYQSVQLFPLPWITGQLTLTRIAQARVKPE